MAKVKIAGLDLASVTLGGNATIFVDGVWKKTSRVKDFFLCGGRGYLVTKNTKYYW